MLFHVFSGQNHVLFSVGSIIEWNVLCYAIGNYVPSFLCIWPINPNHCAVRNLCMALHGQPQPAEQTFTVREHFCRQRLVTLLHLWPNCSLQLCTHADARVWMALAPLWMSVLHWSQHNGVQALPSIQSQDTWEGDEERDVHPSVIQTFWINSVFPGKNPAFSLTPKFGMPYSYNVL